jgi:hypothetical protein
MRVGGVTTALAEEIAEETYSIFSSLPSIGNNLDSSSTSQCLCFVCKFLDGVGIDIEDSYGI